MANQEHLKILEQGKDAWNKWREDKNSPQYPDLIMAKLQDKNLKEYNFKNTKLLNANLQGARLNRAQFQGAFLQECDFRNAIMIKAELQTGTAIEKSKEIEEEQEKEVKKEVERNTQLRRAKFQGANIRSANFAGAVVDGVEFDEDMKCRGASVDGCVGGQRFVRHVKDSDYLEEFQEKYPHRYCIWKTTTNCGRSWARVATACLAFIYFFWIIFDLLKVDNALVTSIGAFTSFGFLGSGKYDTPVLFLICIEACIGFVMLGILMSLVANTVARRSG